MLGYYVDDSFYHFQRYVRMVQVHHYQKNNARVFLLSLCHMIVTISLFLASRARYAQLSIY